MTFKGGNYRDENVIYEAKLKTNSVNRVYIGWRANQIRKLTAVNKTTIKSIPEDPSKYVNATEQKSTPNERSIT